MARILARTHLIVGNIQGKAVDNQKFQKFASEVAVKLQSILKAVLVLYVREYQGSSFPTLYKVRSAVHTVSKTDQDYLHYKLCPIHHDL